MDFFPYQLSYEETLKLKGGRCDDLNLVAAYWMRSIGVPVINDFTPVWANSNFGGHTWLSLLTEAGKHIPFNAAYDNPIIDSLPFKNTLCKVYRRQYKTQKNTFRMQYPKQKEYPGFLYTNNYYDVTSEYVKTTSVEIRLLNNDKSNTTFAYLGVLCQKDWSIVDVGRIVNDQIHFKDVGVNTIYIAFNYDKNKMQVMSNPFLINNELQIDYFIPQNNDISTMVININKDYWWLRKERTYQLTFWENMKWKNMGSELNWDGNKWKLIANYNNQFSDSVVAYKNLPNNAIFRFQNNGAIIDVGSFGRPFIVNNGIIIHY